MTRVIFHGAKIPLHFVTVALTRVKTRDATKQRHRRRNCGCVHLAETRNRLCPVCAFENDRRSAGRRSVVLVDFRGARELIREKPPVRPVL